MKTTTTNVNGKNYKIITDEDTALMDIGPHDFELFVITDKGERIIRGGTQSSIRDLIAVKIRIGQIAI